MGRGAPGAWRPTRKEKPVFNKLGFLYWQHAASSPSEEVGSVYPSLFRALCTRPVCTGPQ